MKASKYDKCKYPSCDGSVTRNPEIGLCNRHCDLLEFMLWALNSIKVKEEEKDSTIKIK
jgi:hypothetical protein